MRALQIAGVVLLLTVGVGAIYFAWSIGVAFVVQLRASDPTVAAAIIAAFGAVLLALVTVWNERRKAIREAHREKKIQVYGLFVDMIFGSIERNVLKTGTDEEHFGSKEFLASMIKFKRDLVFYGSPAVIKAFNAFLAVPNDVATHDNALQRLGTVETLLRAVRADVGLSNFGLSKGDLHRLYVNDYDTATKGDNTL